MVKSPTLIHLHIQSGDSDQVAKLPNFENQYQNEYIPFPAARE